MRNNDGGPHARSSLRLSAVWAKNPGFTAVAVITLALGIGATTAIFSVVYSVLLRPLPYSDPNRIMAIFEVTTKGTWNRLADANFDDCREQNRSFQTMAKYSAYTASVSGASQPTRSIVAHVSPDFLKVFRVQPIIGRDFAVSDAKQGAAPVFVVSYGFREGGQGLAGSHSSQCIGGSIVAGQIAITLILLIGAGLLGRSLMKVLEVDPGFRVDKIVTMDISLPGFDWTKLEIKAAQATFFSDLIDRLKRIPGVHKVGATSGLPLTGGLPDGMFLLMTQDEAPKNVNNTDSLARQFDIFSRQKERLGTADFCVATDGYFQALGIPLLRGRTFEEHHGPNSPHVALISESLARERWSGEDPIGRTIEFGNMDGDLRLLTIVGVVGDVHEYGLDAPPRPTVYVNLLQRPRPAITVTMLTEANPQMVTSAARAILHELNPGIPPPLPNVLADLFGFARVAQISHDYPLLLRNGRACAR